MPVMRSLSGASLAVAAALLATTAALAQKAPQPLLAAAPTDLVAAAPAPLMLAPPGSTAPTTGGAAFSLAPATAPAAPAAAGVDERALRYYAAQNDVAHMAAEIRRLRAANPGWQPPTDLSGGGPAPVDEQPLWDLFAAGRFDQIRQMVARRRAENPAWQPSAEFVAKFDQAQLRTALIAASDAHQWSSVIALAGHDANLLTCANIDTIWRVAEALGKTGAAPRALEAYRYVLANCQDPAQRYATMQKASLVVPASSLDGLIAMGGIGADGRAEFDGIRLDLLRTRLGKAASGEMAAPTAAEVDGFEQAVRGTPNAGDEQLLGWYLYARKDFDKAADWFKAALQDSGQEGSQPSDRAKSAEGLTLALRETGKLQDAETFGYENRQAGPLVSKAYVETVIKSLLAQPAVAMEPERLSRFEAVVDEDRSAPGAQVYGWYLFRQERFADARGWFAKSVAWTPSEDAAIGLALASQRLQDRAGFQAAIAQYGPSYPKVAALKGSDGPVRRFGKGGPRRGGSDNWDASADEIVKLYQRGKYRAAMAALDARAATKKEPGGLKVIRGWTLYQRGDLKGAHQVFEAADNTQSTKATREGMNLSYRGSIFDIFQ